jgi:hypothetical protein
MNKIKIILYLAIVFISFGACKQDVKSTLKPLDLLEYGFPLTIMAPDSAEVKKMSLTLQQDLTIKKGKNFYVQIFSANATTLDEVKLKEEKLSEVQTNPYFSKVVREDEHGFIYEKSLDSTTHNYDFIYVKILGEKEFIHQAGLTGGFNLEDVELMYEAVQ